MKAAKAAKARPELQQRPRHRDAGRCPTEIQITAAGWLVPTPDLDLQEKIVIFLESARGAK